MVKAWLQLLSAFQLAVVAFNLMFPQPDWAMALFAIALFQAIGAAIIWAKSHIPLDVDVTLFQPSVNTVITSYLRITNCEDKLDRGVAIDVVNASTGQKLGTYKLAAIPGRATLQVVAREIERGIGITPTASVRYDLRVRGNRSGEVVHLCGNPANLFVNMGGVIPRRKSGD